MFSVDISLSAGCDNIKFLQLPVLKIASLVNECCRELFSNLKALDVRRKLNIDVFLCYYILLTLFV